MSDVKQHEAEGRLKEILAAWPDLNNFGFGAYDPLQKSPEQRRAEIAEKRQVMTEDQFYLEGFMKARSWLRQFKQIKAINKTGTSYGLKHVAERSIGYVTNGAFIAAAIAEGFRIERTGPNAFLNISARAWDPRLL